MTRARKKPEPAEPASKSRAEVRADILLEDGRKLGDVMDLWQGEDFAALDQHRHAFLERPRGHSKTGDMGTEAVVELVAGAPGLRMYAVAADQAQADLLRDDVAGKLTRGGFVASGAVKIQRDRIVAHNGSTLVVLASDAPTAYGLRPDWICFDEIEEQRDRRLWDALWTATGKRPKCRMLVIGTAGYIKTSLAWEIRMLAEREPSWYFSSRGQCASWVDPEWLAEQRRTLPPHVYARLHLNEWVDQAGAWLTAEQVDRVFRDGVQPGAGRRVLGLDVGLTRNRSAAAVVRLDPEGINWFEHLVTWEPPEGHRQDLMTIESDVLEIVRRDRSISAVVLDPYQTVHMSQRLAAEFRRLGLRVEVVADHITQQTRDGLFGHLRDLVVDQKVRSIEYPALRTELLGLAFERTSGGRYRVDHQQDGADDHVFAAGLAAFWLGGRPAPKKMLQAEGNRERARLAAEITRTIGPGKMLRGPDGRITGRVRYVSPDGAEISVLHLDGSEQTFTAAEVLAQQQRPPVIAQEDTFAVPDDWVKLGRGEYRRPDGTIMRAVRTKDHLGLDTDVWGWFKLDDTGDLLSPFPDRLVEETIAEVLGHGFVTCQNFPKKCPSPIHMTRIVNGVEMVDCNYGLHPYNPVKAGAGLPPDSRPVIELRPESSDPPKRGETTGWTF